MARTPYLSLTNTNWFFKNFFPPGLDNACKSAPVKPEREERIEPMAGNRKRFTSASGRQKLRPNGRIKGAQVFL